MKKVLVTGGSGYIGSYLKAVNSNLNGFRIDYISLRDEKWKHINFGDYDSVLHLAGIAHVSNDKKLKDDYYKINRDLTFEVANKAKNESVNQFIFMSSIIVFGNVSNTGGKIDFNTVPKPKDHYGNSKYEAEKLISNLSDSDFKVCIVRPPMVYGFQSKGNFKKLFDIAKIVPIFPKVNNKKSMIFVGNLCELIFILIRESKSGYFHPQNKEVISVDNIVREVSNKYQKKVIFINKLKLLISFLAVKNNFLNKIFGNLYYDEKISQFELDYNKVSFEESINLIKQKEMAK